MPRISSLIPAWERNNRSSSGSTKSPNTEKVRGWADKIPSPIHRLSRSGHDAGGPISLDRECEKAARILKSFCRDGFAVHDDRPASPSTASSSDSSSLSSRNARNRKKIPPRIIQNAVGLAVFTSMRSGLWTSGYAGSGILIARKTDGTWSPPSGLMLQTASLGLTLGTDVYDCVVVVNTFTMLEKISRKRVTLGTDVTLTAGPLVSMGLLENEIRNVDLSDTAFTYMKTSGSMSDLKMDGIISHERTDENERFYGCNFSVPKILAGDVNLSRQQMRSLTEILKAAEGRNDFDASIIEQLAALPCPSELSCIGSPLSIISPSSFGIPEPEDPDPYGVLALEKAGLNILEAGTRKRPDSSQFEFTPSIASPVFSKASRRSVDTYLSRSNRESYMSSRTMATERSQMTDAFTQTESATTPNTIPSPSQSDDGHQFPEDIPEEKEPPEVDYTKVDDTVLRRLTIFSSLDNDEHVIKGTSIEESVYGEEEEQGERQSDEDTNDTTPGEEPKVVSATQKKELRPEKEEEEEEEEMEAEAEDKDESGNQADDDDQEDEDDDDDDSSDDFEDIEEPVILEVTAVQSPRAIMAAQSVHQVKGAVVNIPRRVPPPLPIRSPARLSRQSKGDLTNLPKLGSPLSQEFASNADASTSPKSRSSSGSFLASDKNNYETVTEHEQQPSTPTQQSVNQERTSPKEIMNTIDAALQPQVMEDVADNDRTKEVDFRRSRGTPLSVA